jgi:hypothetical protein
MRSTLAVQVARALYAPTEDPNSLPIQRRAAQS